MGKYIRRQAVFNEYSDRHMKIWNWVKTKTNDFKNQSFADFARDSLEFRMRYEGKELKNEIPQVDNKIKKSNGWGNLI